MHATSATHHKGVRGGSEHAGRIERNQDRVAVTWPLGDRCTALIRPADRLRAARPQADLGGLFAKIDRKHTARDPPPPAGASPGQAGRSRARCRDGRGVAKACYGCRVALRNTGDMRGAGRGQGLMSGGRGVGGAGCLGQRRRRRGLPADPARPGEAPAPAPAAVPGSRAAQETKGRSRLHSAGRRRVEEGRGGSDGNGRASAARRWTAPGPSSRRSRTSSATGSRCSPPRRPAVRAVAARAGAGARCRAAPAAR